MYIEECQDDAQNHYNYFDMCKSVTTTTNQC